MFTLIGWNEYLAAGVSYVNVKGAADQSVKVVDDRIYCPPLNKLVFSFARGILFRARLKSPSLRRLAYLHIDPSENTTASWRLAYPPQVMYQIDSPLPFVVGEGIEAESYQVGAGDGVITICAALADGPLVPVKGEIWTIRATIKPTVVLEKWANSEITFEQTLPVGRYQIVGGLVSAVDVTAFRFVPIGSMYRPGGITVNPDQLSVPPIQRKGGLGVWCEFDSVTPPSVDVIGQTAGEVTLPVFLDIIKIT